MALHELDVLTVEDVAQMLDCTAGVIDEAARVGDLPGLYFGGGWVFPKGALLHVLNQLAMERVQTARDVERPATAARVAVRPVGAVELPARARPTLVRVPPPVVLGPVEPERA